MRIYYEYLKNSFKELLAYRMEYFTGIIQTLLSLLILIYLWQALMGQSGQATTDAGVITIKDMMTYILVSSLISTLGRSRVIYDINDRVRTGLISTDLIKPINFTAYMFCRMTGRVFSNFFFQFLPVLIVALLFLDVSYPSVQNLLFFLLSTAGALVLLFFISYILGLLSFWYMQIWQVDILLNSFFTLFAGGFIPLWFFPKALITASTFLPFRFGLLYADIHLPGETGAAGVLARYRTAGIVDRYLLRSHPDDLALCY